MSRICTAIAALAFGMLSVAAHPAFAATSGKRVALVVGSGDYQHLPKIKNPKNDAEDIAASLRKLGFAVMLRLDTSKHRFNDSLHDFGEWAEDADVALFYYAGQGVEVQGVNLGPG